MIKCRIKEGLEHKREMFAAVSLFKIGKRDTCENIKVIRKVLVVGIYMRRPKNKYTVGVYLEQCVVFFYPHPQKGVRKLEKLQRGTGAGVKDVLDLQGVNCNLTRSPQATRDV